MLKFRHLVLALLLHVLLVGLLASGVQCTEKIPPKPVMVAVITGNQPSAPKQGQDQIARQLAAQRNAEKQVQEQRQQQAQQAEQQRRVEAERQQRQAAQQAQQQAEASERQQQAEAAERQQQAQQARAAEEAKAEQVRQLAQQEALRKAQEAAERQREAERAEAKAKAEQAARAAEEAARKREADAAAKKAEDARRKEEAARKAREAEQRKSELALQDALAAETAARMTDEALEGVRYSWTAQLVGYIAQRWIRPPGLPDDIYCVVDLELLPTGQIIQVNITRSSGVSAFDDSVLRAVNKSDPLPLPEDPAAFVRQLRITFTPENLG